MRSPIIGVTAATTAAALVLAAGAAPASATTPSPLRTALDRVVATGQAGAIAEVSDEHGRWRGTSGRARIDRPGRPAPEGAFRAGSVTKMFTSAVVLQLVAEGRVGLDDPVEHWLPGVVRGGADDITVRELLDHTSSLPDPSADLVDADGMPRHRWRTWTLAQLADLSNRLPREPYPPGTHFTYSNNDYILLGMIIERATGRSFRDETARRILRPLGLSGTSFPGSDTRLPVPHADGYVTVANPGGGTRTYDVTELNPTMAGSAGEIVSTTRDLNRFLAALLAGRVVRPDLLAEMTAGDNGFGVESATLECGVRVHGHGGGIPGYLTISFASAKPARQVTVSVTRRSQADPQGAMLAFLTTAFCTPSAASAR